ncbi:hypothetical protein [Benzoatithermus flavus]|uniref:Auto-transporter adhesin head GIN domain-containing protein n=1 Tax=Benzoatithermus flavus TaxID=3108223 RepID=A0ABU8XM38_9PROT
MKSLAWVALCAVPLLAMQPNAGLADEPLRLTDDQMDAVNASGVVVAVTMAQTHLRNGTLQVRLVADHGTRRLVVRFLDRSGHVTFRRVVDLTATRLNQVFTVAGNTVRITRSGSVLTLRIVGKGGRTVLVSRTVLTKGGVAIATTSGGSTSVSVGSHSTSVKPGSININHILGGLGITVKSAH